MAPLIADPLTAPSLRFKHTTLAKVSEQISNRKRPHPSSIAHGRRLFVTFARVVEQLCNKMR